MGKEDNTQQYNNKTKENTVSEQPKWKWELGVSKCIMIGQRAHLTGDWKIFRVGYTLNNERGYFGSRKWAFGNKSKTAIAKLLKPIVHLEQSIRDGARHDQ